MRNLNKIMLAATVLVLAAGATFYVGLSPSSNTTDGTTPGAWMHRVIVIAADAIPATETVRSRRCGLSPDCRNGADNIDVTVLESGQMPQHAMLALVQTDTNCAPDAYGISHCSNQLLLADGRTITVRHDHNMARFPCLKPGETVRVETERSV